MGIKDSITADQTKRYRMHGREIFNSCVGVLIEILSWLPASSLSRCRFVCKLWHTLITTDPLLAELQFQRGFGSASPNILTLSLRGAKTQPIYSLSLTDEEVRRQHEVRTLGLPDTTKTGLVDTSISPSCNGMVCIYDHANNISVFNPTIQQNVCLPKPIQFPKSDIAFQLCFLGYLPTSKVYKVLRYVQHFSSNLITCEVYSTSTRSWRQLTMPNFGRPKCRAKPILFGGVVINGLLYCMVSSVVGQRGKGQIMSFDLNNEELDTIQFPRTLTELDATLEFEGSLIVATRTRSESMELWMLQGVKSHDWSQRYFLNISPDRFLHIPVFIHQGKILIKSHRDFYYRNLETGVGNTAIQHMPGLLEIHGHVESLLSLESLKGFT